MSLAILVSATAMPRSPERLGERALPALLHHRVALGRSGARSPRQRGDHGCGEPRLAR